MRFYSISFCSNSHYLWQISLFFNFILCLMPCYFVCSIVLTSRILSSLFVHLFDISYLCSGSQDPIHGMTRMTSSTSTARTKASTQMVHLHLYLTSFKSIRFWANCIAFCNLFSTAFSSLHALNAILLLLLLHLYLKCLNASTQKQLDNVKIHTKLHTHFSTSFLLQFLLYDEQKTITLLSPTWTVGRCRQRWGPTTLSE